MTTGNDRPTKIGKDCKRERWGMGGAGGGWGEGESDRGKARE